MYTPAFEPFGMSAILTGTGGVSGPEDPAAGAGVAGRAALAPLGTAPAGGASARGTAPPGAQPPSRQTTSPMTSTPFQSTRSASFHFFFPRERLSAAWARTPTG